MGGLDCTQVQALCPSSPTLPVQSLQLASHGTGSHQRHPHLPGAPVRPWAMPTGQPGRMVGLWRWAPGRPRRREAGWGGSRLGRVLALRIVLQMQCHPAGLLCIAWTWPAQDPTAAQPCQLFGHTPHASGPLLGSMSLTWLGSQEAPPGSQPAFAYRWCCLSGPLGHSLHRQAQGLSALCRSPLG